MKPHITIHRVGDVVLWFCQWGTNPGSYGHTPKEAYDCWLLDLPF